MRAGWAYLAAAASLGFIACWGSENLFWTAPPDGISPGEFLLTWAGYALVAAAALSVAIWTGLGGWRGAFLGGALLGFGIEGAVVGTMYEAFPAQIVWTALAWHALITGLCILALPIRAARASLPAQIAVLMALGLLGAFWGLYWPTERAMLPGIVPVLIYLPGFSLGVVAAQVALTRLRPQGRIGWWLWVAPAGVASVWLVQGAVAPDPLRLCWPLVVGLTVWAMRRLGSGPAWPDFGPPAPVWRLAFFPLAPLVSALLVVPGWRAFGTVAVNVPVALVSGALGLCLWLWLLVRGFRRAAQPAPP